MAREISFNHDTTGLNLYVLCYEVDSTGNETGKVWDVAGAAFEIPTGATPGDYDVALTEDGSTQHYSGDSPATITTPYVTKIYERQAASPAWSDPQVGQGVVGLIAALADFYLRRTPANVEASNCGDTLSVRSQYGRMMAGLEFSISAGVLSVYKNDGTTLLGTIDLTGTAGADPITAGSVT